MQRMRRQFDGAVVSGSQESGRLEVQRRGSTSEVGKVELVLEPCTWEEEELPVVVVVANVLLLLLLLVDMLAVGLCSEEVKVREVRKASAMTKKKMMM